MIGIAQSKALRATEFLSMNDTSEFLYAYERIVRAAVELVLPRVPSDLRMPGVGDDEIRAQISGFAASFSAQLRNGDGYDSLYIISFAKARDEDEEKRGILTHWDRYTNLKGYCLQFDEGHIEQLLRLEQMWWNIPVLNLVEVRYGVDTSSSQFQTLVRENAEQLMAFLYRNHGDHRFAPNPELASKPDHAARLLIFCATHKDPTFRDEREKRIICFPTRSAEARPFTGIAQKKPIHTGTNGKRYIAIGESIRPGLNPFRIIIGPKASMSVEQLRELYPDTNCIEACRIPIR